MDSEVFRTRKSDAVIFDLYGTLVDNAFAPGPIGESFRHTVGSIAEVLGAPVNEFLQLWDKTGDWRITGVYPSFESYVTVLCGELGVVPEPAQVVEALRLRMVLARGLLTPRRDCAATLSRLQARGYKIGLMTDSSLETVVLWPETAFPPLVDATVFSCAVGMQKPDPRMYALACHRLGSAPERCLYVGDGSGDELGGAERMGLTALRIHVPYELPPDHERPWVGPEISALGQVLNWLD